MDWTQRESCATFRLAKAKATCDTSARQEIEYELKLIRCGLDQQARIAELEAENKRLLEQHGHALAQHECLTNMAYEDETLAEELEAEQAKNARLIGLLRECRPLIVQATPSGSFHLSVDGRALAGECQRAIAAIDAEIGATND